jgi:hypothetical protein
MAELLKSFETGGDSDEPIGDLGGDEYRPAQSFTLDSTVLVQRVDLYLRKVTITDALTVRIETNAAGPKPSGTLAHASATVSVAPSNTSYDWVSFTFPAAFSLTGSTKYWIVPTLPGVQANNVRYEWLRDSGNGYADHGESMNFNAGGYANESATIDLYFRVYGVERAGGNPMFFSSGGVSIG